MYFLVLYSLSGIQKGIQSLHAQVEYALKYGKDKNYKEWASKYKTVILLNGGTSCETHIAKIGTATGTMEQHLKMLKQNNIKCAEFHEPDLNHSMSAIAFLVDERVFDKEKYPLQVEEEFYPHLLTAEIIMLEKLHGGKQNLFLRQFLRNFKLA